jgi:hypothetical protein
VTVPGRRVFLWIAVAIVAGAILMSLEMAAVRLYAPYFGYSIYVWGTTICVVMAALVAGYAIGGFLADRARSQLHLFLAILSAAVWQFLMIWTMRPLLVRLSAGSDIAGVALGTLVIFAPPMIALAATGPILVRLCASAGGVGRAAGLIYAMSTAGSTGGILITIFWLLPTLGTEVTLRWLCAASFLIGASGLSTVESLARRKLAAGISLAPIVLLPVLPRLDWAAGSVWTAESAYNLIRVIRSGNEWLLQLNHPASIHSIREASGVWTGYYYDHFALGPLLVPTRRALVLGMGAGSSIRSLRTTAPNAAIEAVEIDPKIVEASTRWFGLDAGDPRLHIHVADARRWLAENRTTFDIVQLDVYQGSPYIPFYLVTEEFFRLARSRMSGDSLLMMNVFDAGQEPRILEAIAATLRRVFPSVMVARTDPANYMLFAFSLPRREQSLRSIVSRQTGRLRSLSIRDIATRPGTLFFTDDRAPIEAMTRRMLSGR